jgi:SAM-dependent methyltransferase
MDWVEHVVDWYDIADHDTLEVGSLNENGTVRGFFTGFYVGVDMREGRGVDRIAMAHQLPYPDAYFDVVVSTEMLEHDAQFWLSLPEMGRVLKEDGLMILTARGNGFPPHAYPNDYWRFMPDAGPLLLRLAKCSTINTHPDPSPVEPGIFALGRRNPDASVLID